MPHLSDALIIITHSNCAGQFIQCQICDMPLPQRQRCYVPVTAELTEQCMKVMYVDPCVMWWERMPRMHDLQHGAV